MRVFVDNIELEIEKGFSVRHAILRAGEEKLKSVIEGSAWVADEKGDEVGLDGALFDGERLYLKRSLNG